MPLSNYVMNMAWVFLFANWLFEWNMKEKFADFRSNRLLHAVLFLFALHLVGLLWSSNMAYGLDDIRKKLPLLAVPLVVLTSKPLTGFEMSHVLASYTLGLCVAVGIGLGRYLSIPDLPYRDIVPFISHIRFCLMLSMAACLLVAVAVAEMGRGRLSSAHAAVCLSLALGFVAFLFFLQSYTSFIALFAVAFVALVAYWKRLPSKVGKLSCLLAMVAFVVASAVSVAVLVRDYYRPTPLTLQPLQERTVNGNPYKHKQDGVMECGGYVNNYICRKEMQQEWPKYSRVPLDEETGNGYTVYPALIRYLNAMGLPKDSLGMTHLSPDDVAAIERGVGNPVYNKGVSLRRMVYVMLYERENFLHLHSVCNFTMLQRFELWRNGWAVFRQHPLFGTGTGDVVDRCHEQLAIDDSPLAGTSKHTHNQYLTFLITFGVVGFALIAVAAVYPFVGYRRRFPTPNFPLLAIVVISLVSFLSEDTLETLAGILLVVTFLSIFYRAPWPSWHASAATNNKE